MIYNSLLTSNGITINYHLKNSLIDLKMISDCVINLILRISDDRLVEILQIKKKDF